MPKADNPAMCNPLLRLRWLLTAGALFLGVALGASTSEAQSSSYSQSYMRNLTKRPSVGLDVNRYMYDKYFRDNPAVSPYVSGALLGGDPSGTAYTEVVRPDQQRRAAAAKSQAMYVQQRKAMGNVGYTANPGAGYLGSMPGAGLGSKQIPPTNVGQGAYQNHWYGGWNR